MKEAESIHMMQRCASEIESLRKQIGELRPRAEAFDAVQVVLGLLPRSSQGYGEDLVWMLKKAIEKEKEAIAPASEGNNGERK